MRVLSGYFVQIKLNLSASVQDCNILSASALKVLQSISEPPNYDLVLGWLGQGCQKFLNWK